MQSEENAISRRRVLALAGVGLGAALADNRLESVSNSRIVPMMLDAAARTKITTRPLRRGLAMLEGSGGNIVVLSGSDGKLLVDGGFRVSEPRLREALAGIDAAPIRQLINTHWHADHTDSNGWLHAAGATIIAHENTRRRLSVDTRVHGWAYTFSASPAAALPTTVFTTQHRLRINSAEVRLKYYTPAHTDSDISVHFVEANLLHVGDTWWNGVYPFIDYSTGGSIDGSIRAAESNIKAVDADTLVVPGHGQPGSRADLIEFRDMLTGIRQNVAALKKQGRSLQETIDARPTAAYDAKWGQFLITPAMFTGLVYLGV
ncbi:MBL fold metallo-hydrolase [uncultured Paludibaculum sp.]|uniref:MBL fold metallo-hydrolase n=1 Tax=uncultured Paludibaculum sp. TaxID=1765020 RepID=UPI002AAAADD4|nr:MBL fold metallo-hydrolase [uncultured Paludibaculum sp.]